MSTGTKPRDSNVALSSERPFVVWGLTGGIAAGKSLAARFFAEEGIPVLDADQLARGLTAPGGAGYEPVMKRFGTVDRQRLREIVFADSEARRDLEAILHPLIRAESESRLKELALKAGWVPGGAPVPVIYEAALLVETGRYRDLDGLIVVEAPRDIREARLIARDGVSPELARQILDAQTSDEARAKVASVVLRNDRDADALREGVKKVAGSFFDKHHDAP